MWAGADAWSRLVTHELPTRKRRLISIASSANAPTLCGNRKVGRKDGLRNSGTGLVTNVSVNVRTSCGNKKEARKAAQTNTGTGSALSRLTDCEGRNLLNHIGRPRRLQWTV